MTFSQLNKKRRGRVLQRTVSLLAALSVFLTCYVLIIPAITMTKENADTYCGMEEHRHKKSCFDENGNLICPLQEHEHDMLCFTNTASETCLCGFECEHTHNESCYQNGELICTIAEHTHGDSCREKLPKQELTAESEKFTVSVVAPQGALPEGTTMYVLDVIPNGSAEQTQTQATFAFQLLFTDANGQTVTPRRMVYIKALCSGFLYEGNRTVTKIAKDATKEELESIPVSVNGVTFADTEVATYLITCHADEAKRQDMKTLCVTQNDVTVTVEYGKDADIPEDATLSVKEFSPNSKDYQSCVKKSKEAMEDEKIHSARVFDISFRHLGKEIEPKAPVNVSVNSTNPLTDDRSNLRIVHIKDNDETEVLKAAEINEDATQLVYQQASFSAVVITTVENSFTGPYTGDNQYTTVSGSILDNDTILNRFNNDNKWQIVSGEYHGNGSSQKVDVQEHIRGQKNIIPTGVENEFYIYLSLDLDYQNVVTNFLVGEAGIVFTSSNQINDDESTIHGDLCTQAWNDKKATSCTPALIEPTDEMKQKWTLTFKYEVNGKVQSTSVTRYSTNNAYNKGHVCMLLDGTWYEVGEASKASAASTIDIALKSSMVQKVLKGLQDVEIGTLQDSMGSSTAGGESFTTGEGIFVTEVVASAVRGQLVTDNYSISDDNKTINWSPKVSALVPTSNESSSGWFENIAELLYKIKYVAPKSNGLSTGGTSLPDDADAKTSYVVTNEKTDIRYCVTRNSPTATSDGKVYQTLSLTSPVIRGMQYEMGLLKTDDKGNPLPGATFELYTKNGTTRDVVQTVVSDKDGKVAFKQVQSGTYYVKELSAPDKYTKDDTEYGPYVLSYTASASNTYCTTATADNLIGQGSLEEALLSPAQPIVIINTEIRGVVLPQTGGIGTSWYVGAGFALITTAAIPIYIRSKKRKPNQHR